MSVNGSYKVRDEEEHRSIMETGEDVNNVQVHHPNQIQLQFSNSYIGGVIVDNRNNGGKEVATTSDSPGDGPTLVEDEEEVPLEDDCQIQEADFGEVVVRCKEIRGKSEDMEGVYDRSNSLESSEPGFASSIPNQHSHLHHHNRHQHSVYSRRSHQSNSLLLPRSSISGDVCPLSICPMNSDNTSLSPMRRSSIRASSPPDRPSMMMISPKMSLTGAPGTECSDRESCDRTDSLPKDMSFTWIDILAILFSICSFMFDITTDTIVAAFHLKNGDKWYFILTTVFIVVPTLVMTGISLRWYVLDAREEGSPKISPWKWFTRTIFLLLQLGPILRYVDSLIYGLKFRRHKANKSEQKKYYQYMVYEDTDATMLRLFECFMEAAPQLVLQLYILARKSVSTDPTFLVMTQVTAIFASLVSLAWSLVSYHRALRMSLQDKINMSWQGMALQFLWRICVIGARVLALAMFAARYQQYIALVAGIHWVIMFAWIISMRTTFCDNRCEELGYNAVLGVMFIFCYFNPVDSPTRYRYSLFYTFMFLENTLLMTFFFLHPDSIHCWYRLPAMFGHFFAFFLGIALMIMYYLVFHPTQAIKVCRNAADDREAVQRLEARKGGYKRQTSTNVWMNQGRVLHPRPAVPTITSTHSCSEVNMLQHIISPGMHSDKPTSSAKSSPKINRSNKKKKLFFSLNKSSSKSSNESHEKYAPRTEDEYPEPDRTIDGISDSDFQVLNDSLTPNGKSSTAFATPCPDEPRC